MLFNLFKKIKISFQKSAEDCAFSCVVMMLNYYGKNISVNELRWQFPSCKSPLSTKNMHEILLHFGITTHLIYTDDLKSTQLNLPVILHWRNSHFVVLASQKNAVFTIYDPECGRYKIDITEINKFFTGFLLEPTALKGLPNVRQKKLSKTKFKLLENFLKSKKKQFVSILLAMLVAQTLIFISPILIQKAIDATFIYNNKSILLILMTAFLSTKLIESGFSFFKAIALARLGLMLTNSLVKSISHKLYKLSISWFLSQTTGEIYNSVSSIHKISSLHVDNIIESIVDGVISMLMAGILFFYSCRLMLIILFTLLVLICIKMYFLRHAKYFIEMSIKQKTEGDQLLLENIRSIRTIHTFKLQHIRAVGWINKLNIFSKNMYQLAIEKGFHLFIRNIILSLELTAIVFVSIHLFKANMLSLGGFYIIIFYRNQLHEATNRMLDKIFDLQFAAHPIEKIKYLMCEPEYTSIQIMDKNIHFPEENIIINNLSFYYSHPNFIIKNFSCTFDINRSYAIIGSSGCGKTTLMHILMGMIEPTSGLFYFDGSEVKSLNNTLYKNSIASVMQDDSLFSGTIAENIALFPQYIDFNLIKECAEIACIHHDILKMPMTYHTYLGENGIRLSGGQKQRILLARALYKKPKILFLDEATSHLDKATEKLLNQNMASLNITKISVAHRIETIRYADRIVDLSLLN